MCPFKKSTLEETREQNREHFLVNRIDTQIHSAKNLGSLNDDYEFINSLSRYVVSRGIWVKVEAKARIGNLGNFSRRASWIAHEDRWHTGYTAFESVRQPGTPFI